MQNDTPRPSGRPNRRITIGALALAATLLLAMPALAQENAVTPAQAGEEQPAARLEHWMGHPARLPDGVRAAGMTRAFPSASFPGMPGRVGVAAVRLFGDGAFHDRSRAAADWSDPGAFSRWLQAEPRQRTVLPGLVGRLDEGAAVRLSFYDADPAAGGNVTAELSYLAGQDDLEAFQAAVRAAAEQASHVVVDVTGRTIALPQVGEANVDEQVDGD